MLQKFLILVFSIVLIGEAAAQGGKACWCKKSPRGWPCRPEGYVECIPKVSEDEELVRYKCVWSQGERRGKPVGKGKCIRAEEVVHSCDKEKCGVRQCEGERISFVSAIKCDQKAQSETECKALEEETVEWDCKDGDPVPGQQGYKLLQDNCKGIAGEEQCIDSSCTYQPTAGHCATDDGECKDAGDPLERKCSFQEPIVVPPIVLPPPLTPWDFAECRVGAKCPDGSAMTSYPGAEHSACCVIDEHLACCSASET